MRHSGRTVLLAIRRAIAFAMAAVMVLCLIFVPADYAAAASRISWGYQYVQAGEAVSYLKLNRLLPAKKLNVVSIDTGVNFEHEGLDGNIDVDHCMSFLDYAETQEPVPYTPSDMQNDHGTFMAGIIVGNGKTGGVLGIASDPNTGEALVNYSCLQAIEKTQSKVKIKDVEAALEYAYEECHADVIVICMGHENTDKNQNFATRIGAKISDIEARSKNKTVFVSSAGNLNVNADLGGTNLQYPSDFPEVISAVALSKYSKVSQNAKASYSSYGLKKDVAAPGTSIRTAYGIAGYRNGDGTSAAAAITAGTAALVKSADRDLTYSQVKRLLQKTATHLGTAGRNIYTLDGCINAFRAVRAAADEKTMTYEVSEKKPNKVSVKKRKKKGKRIATIRFAKSDSGMRYDLIFINSKGRKKTVASNRKSTKITLKSYKKGRYRIKAHMTTSAGQYRVAYSRYFKIK